MIPQTSQLPYQDAGLSIEARLDDLLSRMTLEEKVGQLNMPLPLPAEALAWLGREMPSSLEECERFAQGTYTGDVGPGGGFFGVAETHLAGGPGEQAAFFNKLQEIARTRTRLGVPLLQTEEGTHGLMCAGATIFPEGPALGSTWNTGLIEEVYAAAAREARAVGIHQLCTLVVEPARDPRLGRNCEAYTEDPYLASRIAEAVVSGVQGENTTGGTLASDKAIAVLCHFPGQSQPVSGLERGAMEVSERVLRETFLPSWTAGITVAGALGVMATYPAIDGVPAHGSERLLTGILRDELGFQGIVLSEGMGFETLIYEGIVATQAEAGAQAIRAGVDVNITYEDAYLKPLIENVRAGIVPAEWVDRATRRVLAQKFRLGLFEAPFVDAERAAEKVHTQAHADLALSAAHEGIVLLKNDGNLLPLSKAIRSVAVFGPNADAPRNQLGDYTTEAVLQPVTTVLAGIRAKVAPGTAVTYVKGCDVLGEDRSGFAEAIAAAQAADIAVVVVGEQVGSFFDLESPARPTVGERSDVASLDLTGVQEELIRAIHETGVPTVVVLINGRPLSIRWTAEHVPAILEAWFPGERGGEAIADVLFGDANPSGRLPVSVPRHAGQLPVYYNYKPSKAYWAGLVGYVDMPATPLYPFGHGLSYTRFEYSDLRLSAGTIPAGGELQVSADVRNAGERPGAEVVQLYLRDVVSSVATPVKQLRGFRKVGLAPGEKRTVTFTLGPADLALLDAELRWTVEPGAFEVMVGSSSSAIALQGTFVVEAQ